MINAGRLFEGKLISKLESGAGQVRGNSGTIARAGTLTIARAGPPPSASFYRTVRAAGLGSDSDRANGVQ
eukprot:768005-Hanusia_phi.AAC.4